MTQETIESLQAVVERITFHSEESGYTVARCRVPKVRDLVTIVGNFADVQPGQTLQLEGQWSEHPQYGDQFRVRRYKETKPATLTGIEKYLGSGLIKGIGPVTAKRIVNHFGIDTLEINELLDRAVERLSLEEHQPDPMVLDRLISEMAVSKELEIEGHNCYKPSFLYAERTLSDRLKTLLSTPVEVDLP